MTNNISNLIELENLPEIDVFFPIVHGNLGEDGVLQGLFRLMNKPFVGDDVLGAAVTMDKEFTKILAQRVGVPVADWISIKRFEYDDKKNAKLNYEKVAEKLGRDMFVKPSNQGSSVGVSHVTNADEYTAALKEAFKYDDKVLVEETVPGTEVETAVLGNDMQKVHSTLMKISMMIIQLLSYKSQQIYHKKLSILLEKMHVKFMQQLNVAAWLELTPCSPQVARWS